MKKYSNKDISLSHVHKNTPDIIIKVSIKAILVTLLVTLKMLLSVEIKFWNAVSRMTFKNLGSFQDKCLWSSPVLVNLLPLRFTVTFTIVLKVVILGNFIIWTMTCDSCFLLLQIALILTIVTRKDKILFSCNVVILWLDSG